MNTATVIITIIILIIIMFFLSHISQSTDDNRDDIIRELKSKKLELIEIKTPKLFETGPFPKFEISFGPQTKVMGVSGEKTHIRKVKYRDRKGNKKESWVKIEVTAFIIVEMEWIPELS